MTREEKQLVFRDLCSRVPYNTIIDGGVQGYVILNATWLGLIACNIASGLEPYLPYLRPMSSMTEKEKAEYDSFNAPTANRKVWLNRIDWLLSKHFDLRGLIPLGLALEAHEGMYNN